MENGIDHPLLRQLLAYWESRRGNRAMPARRDLDPLDIPGLLRHLILLDVTHDPLRFRVRLYGTEVVDLRGRDLTGRYLYEGEMTAIGEQTRPWNVAVVESRRPHHVTGPYTDISDGRIGTFHRLGLPLSEDGKRVDMLMTGLVREWEGPL
ncbi:MAG: PAS domain-containing protein [Thalassobaculaceae bacterium]|nr:PAS domain-containing protein [Thalassobaculaceae bacterium]